MSEKNILKFIKENGLKAADIIATIKEQMGADDLLTGEEKAVAEKLRLEAEAADNTDSEETEEEVEEAEPEDTNAVINKLIDEKFKNMEINLTNHINDALKIKRKKNPGAVDPTPEEQEQIDSNNKIEMNHFEVLV